MFVGGTSLVTGAANLELRREIAFEEKQKRSTMVIAVK